MTILNPRNQNTEVEWSVDGSPIAGSNSLTFDMAPLLFGSIETLSGTHYAEVKLKDSSGNLLDKRRWIIDFVEGDESGSSLSIGGENPLAGASYTYSKAVDEEVLITATINDPAIEGYYYKWYLDDEVVSDPGSDASNDASFLMVFGRYINGQHTLTLKLKNDQFDTLIEEVFWGINILD